MRARAVLPTLLLLLGTSAVYAVPTVKGQVISWPNDDWNQIQAANTHQQVRGESGSRTTHRKGRRSEHAKGRGESGSGNSAITVNGNVISWPDDGWYQVRLAGRHKSICSGGRSCEVEPGRYVVINRTTGKRFNNIRVEEQAIQAPIKLVAVGGAESIQVSWDAVTDATGYNIYVSEESPVVVGASGVMRYSSDSPTFVVTDVVVDATYYIAVGAEVDGKESGLSDEASAKPDAYVAVASVEPEMVTIPSGTFTMGCVEGRDNYLSNACYGNEKPAHSVTVAAFELSSTEVTFEQWDACVEGGGCNGYEPSDEGWGRGSRPVMGVSWNDAQAYITWLTKTTGKAYRLPSEAEWEYAARGGGDTTYSWGNDIGIGKANCSSVSCGDDYANTAPVGRFDDNGYGLFDMQGNVWEWLEDCYHETYDGAPATAVVWEWEDDASCSDRVVRGGSWYTDDGDLRSASRAGTGPAIRDISIGFRVALGQ